MCGKPSEPHEQISVTGAVWGETGVGDLGFQLPLVETAGLTGQDGPLCFLVLSGRCLWDIQAHISRNLHGHQLRGEGWAEILGEPTVRKASLLGQRSGNPRIHGGTERREPTKETETGR